MELVTVHPASPLDFLDYDKLMNKYYGRRLLGNIKKNHIFTCSNDGAQMIIRQSNLDEHCEYVIYLQKKGPWDISRQDIIRILDEVFKDNI